MKFPFCENRTSSKILLARLFDDYGRAISGACKSRDGGSASTTIVVSMPQKCAVSVHIKFLPKGDEVESKTLRTPNLPGVETQRGKEHVGKAVKREGM
jgi:hypothetical protein